VARRELGARLQQEQARRPDTLTPAEVASWKPGDTLLLNGKMLTGRDAAHKRIQDMLAKGEPLPVDFTNRVIYYVGPVDPVRDEVVGPAGPTTATRMDKFTEMMLEQDRPDRMVGKAERGPVAIEAIKKHKSAYLMAVGGAAYLVAKAIKGAKVWALPTWAWKPSTSSTSRTCRSPWPWTPAAPACTRPAPRTWQARSARSRSTGCGLAHPVDKDTSP
jgi:tartrate/fumarate subfamily iron-sulfur-dependent hydro-lyase beta chain